MRYFVSLSGHEIPVDVAALPDGRWDVRVEGRSVAVDVAQTGSALSLLIEGRVVDLDLAGAPPTFAFAATGTRGEASIETDRARAERSQRGAARSAESAVVAPMPGRIVRVLVAEGERVTMGTALVVVEAMKMENELRAGHDATVRRVLVAAGATVEAGARLVELE
jgi:biotin carboxyl carrier protein